MRRSFWMLAGGLAVTLSLPVVLVLDSRGNEPPVRPISPEAAAIVHDLQTFRTFRAAVSTSFHWRASNTSIEGVLQADAAGRLTFDTRMGRRRFSLLDSHTILIHGVGMDHGPYAPYDLQDWVPFILEAWRGVREGSVTWVGRRPHEAGLRSAPNPRDFAEAVLPFPWAEGWRVFLLMLHEKAQVLEIYSPGTTVHTIHIWTWEVDPPFNPDTLRPEGLPGESPYFPENPLALDRD